MAKATKTFRCFGHFQGDAEVYRPKDEVKHLRALDPIPKLAARLKQDGVLTAQEEEAIVARARRVDEAFAFARQSPYPAPQEALEDVFVRGG
nr:thiamine pyrophosphate-dependent enzyme [Tepidiphilus baoligensis]